jgi:hypothetical protein
MGLCGLPRAVDSVHVRYYSAAGTGLWSRIDPGDGWVGLKMLGAHKGKTRILFGNNTEDTPSGRGRECGCSRLRLRG